MEGYAVELAVDGGEARASSTKRRYDLVLLDLMMPDRSGMDVLAEIRARDQETPIIMLTAYGSVEVAVNAIKAGANDYFSKPWDNEKLLIEIATMIAKSRLERENTHLKRALKQRYSFPNIVGKSERMLRVLDLVSQVAPSRSTILLTGETGTGKEVIAKAIHANSPRAERSFVAVNSGSLPPELLESTLFGHVKGAFTSAYASQKGLFRDRRRRHDLLRRDRQRRTGDAVQAAARDPGAGVHAARLDRDRQGGRAHHRRHERRSAQAGGRRPVPRGSVLPPERHSTSFCRLCASARADIPLLVDHFFQKYSEENEKFLDPQGKTRLRFAADAMQLLMEHTWPGNVRELENAVERAVVLAADEVVPVDVLPDQVLHAGGVRIRRDESGRLPADASLFEMVADFERRKIIEALEACNWSQTEAAEMLHIPLSTLNQKIKRLDIQIKRAGLSRVIRSAFAPIADLDAGIQAGSSWA